MALKLENNLGNIFELIHANNAGNISLTSKDLANAKTVNNIAGLKLTNGFVADKLEVLGYYEKGDGGGGTFYWDATSTETDNGGTIIQATGVSTGRWKRVFSGDVNVKWFGAKGDGITDDTLAIQKAVSLSGIIDGNTKTYKITRQVGKIFGIELSSNTVIKNATFVYDSNNEETSNIPIYAINKGNITLKKVAVIGENFALGNHADRAAVRFEVTSGNLSDIDIQDCTFYNTNWGISITTESGSGSITNIKIKNNKVSCEFNPSWGIYSGLYYADGIHVAGKIFQCFIQDNIIENRGDAAIAASSISGAEGDNVIISNNIILNCRIAIDAPGSNNIKITNNKIYNALTATPTTTGGISPCIRVIKYVGSDPLNIDISNNTIYSAETYVSDSFDINIEYDTATDCNVNVYGNTFKKLYCAGNGVSIYGNTITTGGSMIFNVKTYGLTLGDNLWEGDVMLTFPNSSDITVRTVSRQTSNGELVLTNVHRNIIDKFELTEIATSTTPVTGIPNSYVDIFKFFSNKSGIAFLKVIGETSNNYYRADIRDVSNNVLSDTQGSVALGVTNISSDISYFSTFINKNTIYKASVKTDVGSTNIYYSVVLAYTNK